MIRWIGTVLLIFIIPSLLCAQGVPIIHHYSSEVMGSHPQIWAVTQDSSGYLYFGSQGETIVKFDSANWESLKYKPDTGAIRSLQVYNRKIHWGGVGDLGFLESDSLNDFTLVSLKDQIDSTDHSFADVWQMLKFEDKLYHRASNAILILEQDTIRVIESEETLRGIFKVDSELWASRDESGLARLENDRWSRIPGAEPYEKDRLIAALPYPGYHLLIFRNSGLVRFDGSGFTDIPTDMDDYFREHSLYRATAINENEIGLAFLNGGILVMKNDGTIRHVLTEEYGLPTNVIYDVYTDREGTLWATSADGVIKILTNNPIVNINEQNGLDGNTKFIEPNAFTGYIKQLRHV